MQEKLSQSLALSEEHRPRPEVENAEEEFSPVAVVDDTLDHEEVPLSDAGGPTDDPAPYPRRQGDLNVGVYVGKPERPDPGIAGNVDIESGVPFVLLAWDVDVLIAIVR